MYLSQLQRSESSCVWNDTSLSSQEETLNIENPFPLPKHLRFRHGDEKRIQLFNKLYQQGIIDHHGVLRGSYAKKPLLSFSKEEVLALYSFLKSNGIVDYLKKIIHLEDIYGNRLVDSFHFIGSYVPYFLICLNSSYLQRTFQDMEIENLFHLICLDDYSPPVDGDIEISVPQAQFPDFKKIRDWTSDLLCPNGFEKHVLINDSNALFQVLKPLGSYFEFKFSAYLPRELVFDLEDLSLPLTELIEKGPSVSLTPISKTEKNRQALFDHVFGIARGQNIHTVSGKEALRLVSNIVRGKDSGTQNMSNTLFVKWLSEHTFDGILNLQELILDIQKWFYSHHSEEAVEIFCFLFTLSQILSRYLDSSGLAIFLKFCRFWKNPNSKEDSEPYDLLKELRQTNLYPLTLAAELLFDKNTDFFLVRNVISLALFHNLSRDIFSFSCFNKIFSSSEEFNIPILRAKIFSEKKQAFLYLNCDPLQSCKELSDYADKMKEKWIVQEPLFLKLLYCCLDKNVFSSFSFSFSEKLPAFSLTSSLLKEEGARLFASSFFFRYLGLLFKFGNSEAKEFYPYILNELPFFLMQMEESHSSSLLSCIETDLQLPVNLFFPLKTKTTEFNKITALCLELFLKSPLLLSYFKTLWSNFCIANKEISIEERVARTFKLLKIAPQEIASFLFYELKKRNLFEHCLLEAVEWAFSLMLEQSVVDLLKKLKVAQSQESKDFEIAPQKVLTCIRKALDVKNVNLAQEILQESELFLKEKNEDLALCYFLILNYHLQNSTESIYSIFHKLQQKNILLCNYLTDTSGLITFLEVLTKKLIKEGLYQKALSLFKTLNLLSLSIEQENTFLLLFPQVIKGNILSGNLTDIHELKNSWSKKEDLPSLLFLLIERLIKDQKYQEAMQAIFELKEFLEKEEVKKILQSLIHQIVDCFLPNDLNKVSFEDQKNVEKLLSFAFENNLLSIENKVDFLIRLFKVSTLTKQPLHAFFFSYQHLLQNIPDLILSPCLELHMRECIAFISFMLIQKVVSTNFIPEEIKKKEAAIIPLFFPHLLKHPQSEEVFTLLQSIHLNGLPLEATKENALFWLEIVLQKLKSSSKIHNKIYQIVLTGKKLGFFKFEDLKKQKEEIYSIFMNTFLEAENPELALEIFNQRSDFIKEINSSLQADFLLKIAALFQKERMFFKKALTLINDNSQLPYPTKTLEDLYKEVLTLWFKKEPNQEFLKFIKNSSYLKSNLPWLQNILNELIGSCIKKTQGPFKPENAVELILSFPSYFVENQVVMLNELVKVLSKRKNKENLIWKLLHTFIEPNKVLHSFPNERLLVWIVALNYFEEQEDPQLLTLIQSENPFVNLFTEPSFFHRSLLIHFFLVKSILKVAFKEKNQKKQKEYLENLFHLRNSLLKNIKEFEPVYAVTSKIIDDDFIEKMFDSTFLTNTLTEIKIKRWNKSIQNLIDFELSEFLEKMEDPEYKKEIIKQFSMPFFKDPASFAKRLLYFIQAEKNEVIASVKNQFKASELPKLLPKIYKLCFSLACIFMLIGLVQLSYHQGRFVEERRQYLMSRCADQGCVFENT